MRPIVTGSIATDHLMVFPGLFTEQLVEGKLDKVSLSFLVDELQIYRGGIAANVAFGMARLGLRPMLVGSVGADFADYRQWLEAHDVDTRHVRVSERLHTARFLCTTDADNNQIASFYAGAMSEARQIGLDRILRSEHDADIVLICPDDPEAMLRHTQACRDCAVPFAADPSQQIARMDGTDLRRLVDGARYLFTNEYERALLIRKTGWDAGRLLDRVGAWVTTTGPQGAVIESATGPAVSVPAAALTRTVDPTGAGDAFRAGFLAGIGHGLGHEGAARLGCSMAALVMETSGTQEYLFRPEEFLARIGQSYGSGVAAEMSARIRPAQAGTLPVLRDSAPRGLRTTQRGDQMGDISRVGVVGSGVMGAGIAEVCARAGLDVLVAEVSAEAARAGRDRVARSLHRAIRAGKLTQAGLDKALSTIRFVTDLAEFADRELVIEAITERAEAKSGLLATLDTIVAGRDAILASNTSSIPIMKLATATSRAPQVIGIHFFNPVPVLSLVELIPCLLTSEETCWRAEAFVTATLGKTAIRCPDRAGFVVNALLIPYLLAAIRMLESGFAAAEDIDTGMVLGCGHPMGPLRLADLIGLDTVAAVARSMHEEFAEPPYAPPPLLLRMVDAGLLGKKAGHGFYDYTELAREA